MKQTDIIEDNSAIGSSTQNKQKFNHGSPRQTSSLSMIVTLGSVAMLSGFLVVLVWQLTLEPISKNQQIMIEQAIFQVIQGASQRRSFTLTDTGLEPGIVTRPSDKNNLQFYAAYDNQGQLQGIAAKAAAQGYADMVHLLYGYEPQCECIRGFSIIKMAETPGLGDKILTDENFLDNFSALDARLNSDKTALQNHIISVKHGSKINPWEIDAISGATITSKAVGKAINQSAAQLLPKLQPVLKQLQSIKADADNLPAASRQISSNQQNLAAKE